ncbi:MAG TPA: hypothetical protein VLZ74_16755 [Methylocella sp.]|nr:hypothetical protein [Methylocella sp.]
MISLNTKLVLSALGIVAMLNSPALAQKSHRVARANQSAVYNVVPGFDQDGRTVAIPDPDQGILSQR